MALFTLRQSFIVTPAKAGAQSPRYLCDHGLLMQPCVYILASQRNGTLYVGVTSGLGRRVSAHKADAAAGFTKRYAVHMLVYAEFHATMTEAILREKRIKKWRRAWKLRLIEGSNPAWKDLSCDIER